MKEKAKECGTGWHCKLPKGSVMSHCRRKRDHRGPCTENSEGAEPRCDHKYDGLWRLIEKGLSVDRGEKRVTMELVKSSPVGRDVRI